MNGPKVGQRIRLTGEMPEEAKHDPLPIGATGVVEREANSVGQIYVRWEPPHAHRRLMLLTSDPFEVVLEDDHDCDDFAVPHRRSARPRVGVRTMRRVPAGRVDVPVDPNLRRARDAARRLEQARIARDEAIRAAHPKNSLAQIADAVGLSKAGVQKIVEAGR